MSDRVVEPQTKAEDDVLDQSLRPKRLDEYIGQDRVKENLKIFLQAAKTRAEPLDH